MFSPAASTTAKAKPIAGAVADLQARAKDLERSVDDAGLSNIASLGTWRLFIGHCQLRNQR